MKAIRIYFSIILFGVIIFLQTGCRSQPTIEAIITVPSTETLVHLEATNTLGPISTPTLIASLTPNPTIDSTQQSWHSTALAMEATERAVNQQSQDEKETQVAEFSSDCENVNLYPSKISPDGNWLAVSCGYKRNQTLTVQNKNGTKWVLDFKDFLSKESSDEIMGLLSPKFWSPDGSYLFFTIGLGYEGGGNDCFPQDRGAYGLFRLNVKTGAWATLIPPTDSFPGYEIEFSPTGRRYAITLDSVLITDLQTGESTKLATDETIERLSWSPDGKYLAYSLASCDEQHVISSAIYTWDASTNQTQVLLERDGIILRPESWVDNSMLRIIGEEITGLDTFYTIYQYNIQQGSLVFTSTATPNP